MTTDPIVNVYNENDLESNIQLAIAKGDEAKRLISRGAKLKRAAVQMYIEQGYVLDRLRNDPKNKGKWSDILERLDLDADAALVRISMWKHRHLDGMNKVQSQNEAKSLIKSSNPAPKTPQTSSDQKSSPPSTKPSSNGQGKKEQSTTKDHPTKRHNKNDPETMELITLIQILFNRLASRTNKESKQLELTKEEKQLLRPTFEKLDDIL